jgi:mono/diheme cytochrome c family protein
MKKLLKMLAFALLTLAFAALLLTGYVTVALPDVGEAPELTVALTPAKIERGKYLAYHVMMCADCHSERDFTIFSAPPHPGTEFVGGDVFDQKMGFPGRFVSANITPYGIGDWTDGELFRLITTGVKRDGDPIFPVMPYHSFGKLDADDIESVIAYLRTLDPVTTNHPKSEADFPMDLIMRTMPVKSELAEKPSPNDQIAYGKYMFTAAACGDCHTKFEKGEFIGPLGGGGREMEMPGGILRTPNLTPHETGIGHYTKESFINRFKSYAEVSSLAKVDPVRDFQTIMPWYMYSGMTEEDLGAIFEFLKTLEPHNNPVERFTPATK